MNHRDIVAFQLALNHANFVFNDVLDAKIKIRHGARVFGVVVRAVKAFVVETGKVQNRLAHRFAGDRARVGAHPADGRALFDDRHPLAGFGSLNCGALSAGTRTNDNQIKRLHSQVPPWPVRDEISRGSQPLLLGEYKRRRGLWPDD